MASKSKRRGRVFRASCILAALIIAGSSFAWFTSKDEVTNRLSANSDYNVTIAEDFQPPENWLPGQKVNKDVSAVNTGNVDAFVRMWLEGEMSLIKKESQENSPQIPDDGADAKLGKEDVDNKDDMYSMGYKFYDNGQYYKILDTGKTANDDNANDANTNHTVTDADENVPAKFSEVQAVQAGGYLVYAPTDAKWSYVLEQNTELKATNNTVANYPKGTKVGTAGATDTNVTIAGGPQNIDSDTFVPETSGLYIFRRNIALNSAANTMDDFEYTGYYFDGTNYWALRSDKTSNRSEYVLPDGAVTVISDNESNPQKEPLDFTIDRSKIKLYAVKENIVQNGNISWQYNATYGAKEAVGTQGQPGYVPAVVGTPAYVGTYGTGDEQVKVVVHLANIGTDSQKWTEVGSGATATFYYNDDLEEGDTTTKLVESVELDSSTKKEAFIKFDFDLNVLLESIQVTMSEVGQEVTTPVSPWAAATDGAATPANVNTGATGTASGYDTTDTNEIATITWAETT